MNAPVAPEMRIFSPSGEPLYLNADERERFLAAVRKDTDRNAVIFGTLLHYTGARPTELRELTVDRVNVDESIINLRTIKKRRVDKKGNLKQAQFRSIPIPEEVMNLVVLAFDILAKQKKGRNALLWPSDDNPKIPVNESTVYRWVKRNMVSAGITGKKATSKGLRHGFGVHMVLNGVPLVMIKDLMGHTSTQTTEIYLQVMGGEKKEMVLNTWKNN
ncbi:tyrosine-type recombinase/integrase [Arenicella xantha]|nr:site-specific integrase [Arenicella xantha]